MFKELDKISEVAGYLWEKGWAEYNGGNISVNVTASLSDELRDEEPRPERIALPAQLKLLAGELFYVTGTGKRMRDVAGDLWGNGAVIRICDDGRGYEIVYKENIPPTSELASHLFIHHYLREMGRDMKVVPLAHAAAVLALSHLEKGLGATALTRLL